MRSLCLFLLALLVGCGPSETPRADTQTPQGSTAVSPQGSTAVSPQGQATVAPQAKPAITGRFDTSHAGTQAPDLALETAPDGTTETIADILAANPGKPLLVNLWATWCAPCIRELGTLDRLAGETGLLIIPVSQDMEGWQVVTPAWEKLALKHLATRLEAKMQFGFQLKAAGLPLSILYGPDGREIWRYAGDRDWNDRESRARLNLSPAT